MKKVSQLIRDNRSEILSELTDTSYYKKRTLVSPNGEVRLETTYEVSYQIWTNKLFDKNNKVISRQEAEALL